MNRSCPTPEQLQQLTTGQLADPPATEVESHVLECVGCQQLTASFGLQDTFIDQVREAARSGISAIKSLDEADQIRVERIIEEVSGLRSRDSLAKSQLSHVSLTDDELLSELATCWQPSERDDEVGRLGGFRLLKLLGAGGMGVVLLAEDAQLQRRVALKTLKPEFAAQKDAAERFLREARAAAAVKHEHVVTIYQVGEAIVERPTGRVSIPFLAQELLEGESLEDCLRRESPLPTHEAVRIGAEIAEGLAAAHAKGLIHRDIKPANVWLESSRHAPRDEPSGHTVEMRSDSGRETTNKSLSQKAHHAERDGYFRVKLLDFGLARAEADDTHLTTSGMIVGTPSYMAPEQAGGEAVDARVDLFSLGVVLYRMTTGRLPFPGKNVMEILKLLATVEPAIPATLNAQIPAELSDFILRLLEKDRDRRPSSATEVARELRRMAALGRPAVPSCEVAKFDEAKTVEIESKTQTRTAEGGHPTRRLTRRWLATALAAACVLFGVIVIKITNKEGIQTTVRVPAGTDTNVKTDPGSKIEVSEDNAALPARNLVGSFIIEWTETEGTSGTTNYHFQADGRFLKGGRSLGRWRAIETGFRLDYDEAERGHVDLSLLSENQLHGTHFWQDGKTATWKGRRANAAEPLVVQKSPFDALDPAAIPAEERFEWQPKELVAVLGSHRQRNWAEAIRVSLSADGSVAAAGCAETSGSLSDVSTGTQSVAPFPKDSRVVALSPDGQILYWQQRTAMGLLVKEGKEWQPRPLPVPLAFNNWNQASFSMDGRWLTTAVQLEVVDGVPRYAALGWDVSVNPPKLLFELMDCMSPNLSPDGQRLAVVKGKNKTVRVFDVTTIPPPTLFDVVAAEMLPTSFPRHGFLANGLLATLDRTSKLCVWDVSDAEPKLVAERDVSKEVGSSNSDGFRPFRSGEPRLAWKQESKFGTWRLSGDEIITEFVQSMGSLLVANIRDIAVSDDGSTLATTHINGMARFWARTDSGIQEKRPIQPQPGISVLGGLRVVQIAPDGRHFATRSEDGMRVWRLGGSTCEAVPVAQSRDTLFGPVAFIDQDHLISYPDPVGASSARPREWKIEADRVQALDRLSDERFLPLLRLPNGLLLAPGAKPTEQLSLWDGRSHPAKLLCSWSAAPNGRTLARTEAPNGSYAVSADGRIMASVDRADGQPDIIRLWQINEPPLPPTEITSINSENIVYQLALSSDGKKLTVGSLGGLSLWSLNGNQAERLWRKPGYCHGVALTPDDQHIAASFRSGSAEIPDNVSLFSITGECVAEWSFPSVPFDLSFAPDGRHLITVNTNGTIYVLRTKLVSSPQANDLATARTRTEIGSNAPAGVTKSPLNALAPAQIPAAERFDWQPKELVAVLGSHAWRHWGSVEFVAIHPEGNLIASVSSSPYQDGVRVWEAASGKLLAQWPGWCAAFTEEGRELITPTADGLVVRETHSWGVRKALKKFLPATEIAVSRKANIVAGFAGLAVQVWDLATDKLLLEQTLPTSAVYARGIAVSPDGQKLVVACFDGLRMWSVATGQSLAVPEAVNPESVAFSADGQLLAANSDVSVKVWNLADGSERITLTGHGKTISSLAFSTDGSSLASASGDHSVRIWNLKSGESTVLFNNHRSATRGVAFATDGQTIVSCGDDAAVRLWNVTTGQQINSIKPDIPNAWLMALTPDDRTLAVGATGYGASRVALWDVPAAQVRDVWDADEYVLGLALDRTTQRLATVGYAGVQLWNLPGLGKEPSLEQNARATAVTFSPDGTTLSALVGTDPEKGLAELRFWQLSTGKLMDSLPAGSVGGYGNWLEFSPDGTLLARADRANLPLQIWDMTTRKMRWELPPSLHPRFSRDGKWLLAVTAGREHGPTVYDTSTGKPLANYHGRHAGDGATCAVFLDDDQTIVSAGNDGQIIEWTSPRKSRVLCKLPGPVLNLALASDGRHLFTANSNGTVYVLRLTPLIPKPIAAEPDRRTAEWVLSNGGSVTIQSVSGNVLSLAPTSQLPATPFVLQGVVLRGVYFSDDDLAVFEGLTGLTTFDCYLSGTRAASGGLTDVGLAHLKGLTTLTTLNLGGRHVTNDGLDHLSELKELTFLGLFKTKVTDAGMERLTGLSKLQNLSLEATKITDQVIPSLLTFQNLTTLSLNGCENFSDAGIEQLSGLPQLSTLGIGSSKTGDATIARLRGIKNLKSLTLTNANITDDGVKELSEFRPLVHLSLSSNKQITDIGISHLASLQNLTSLNLQYGPTVSAAGIAPLQMALPKCVIRWDNPEKVTGDSADYAVHLDARQAIVVEAPVLGLNSNDPMTLELWVQPDAAAAESSNWIMATVSMMYLQKQQQSGRELLVSSLLEGAPGGVMKSTRGFAWPKRQRMHVAAISEYKRTSLYVDGKLIGTAEVDAPRPATPVKTLRIGHEATAFSGIVDEVRLSRGVRYAKDFQPSARFEPDDDTLVLLHCDEGDGEWLRDASGRGNDGRISPPKQLPVRWVRADDSVP